MAPALDAFRAWAPNARVAVVMRRGHEAVVECLPQVDEVMLVEAGIRGLAGAALAARRFRPDLAVDYHGTWPAAAIVAASGARLTIGEDRFRWRIYDIRVPRTEHIFGLDRRAHTVENHLAPLAAIGIPTATARLSLPVEPGAREALAARLSAAGVPPGPRVVLFPTTSHPGKQWPLERWHRLAGLLAAAGRGAVVLAFAPGEEPLAAHARGQAPSAWAITGLPIRELIALVSSATVVVAHDSLGAHLAAAVGVLPVVLFGASDPARFHPWGDHVALRVQGLCCSPCGRRSCRSPYHPLACLQALDEGVVLETVLARLRAAA
jgi:ADP-heptose:LPS heptosyltransferase